MSTATLIRPTAATARVAGEGRPPLVARAARPVVPAASAAPARFSASPRPVRITRRGRTVVVLVALAAMLVALAAVRVSTQATSTATPVGYATVVVQPGQTLWGIAQGLAPAVDPRVTVAQLVELNDLDGGGIDAGQRLQVPSAR